MTSSNENIFRVTGPLCGEFTGPGEFPTQWPVTRSFDVFFDLRLNKRLSKQTWGWWFETLSIPLWRHHNGSLKLYQIVNNLHQSATQRASRAIWGGYLICSLWQVNYKAHTRRVSNFHSLAIVLLCFVIPDLQNFSVLFQRRRKLRNLYPSQFIDGRPIAQMPRHLRRSPWILTMTT